MGLKRYIPAYTYLKVARIRDGAGKSDNSRMVPGRQIAFGLAGSCIRKGGIAVYAPSIARYWHPVA